MDFNELLKMLGIGGNALTIIVSFAAWNLTREKKLMEERIEDLKNWTRSIQSKVDLAWTKAEQSEYRAELDKRLDRIEDKIDRLLEAK